MTFFLCAQHDQTAGLSPTLSLAAPTASRDPVSQITPRALYELVSLTVTLFTALSLMLAVLTAPAPRRLVPQTLPPPTPPPRPSHT